MSSTFLRLTDYCIAEYIPTPVTSVPGGKVLTTEFYKVVNNNFSPKQRQIYNTDAANNITRNSRDLTVVAVGNSKAIYLDPTLSPIYTEYDQNIIETLVDPVLTSLRVFETVKLHFASGFNFTEVRNIIFGIKHILNDNTQLIAANCILDSQTAQEIFSYNLRPLFIGSTIYDRYLEIDVPSIAWMIDDFDTLGANSFAHAITDGIGFSKSASPLIFLGEAAYEEFNAPNNITYDQYQINTYYESPVSKDNKFEPLGCYIAEATDGDYIEYFATWGGAFPEDAIAQLNSTGVDQDWILVHQLQVYEHVGGDLIPSSNQIIYQEGNFDTPQYFRPILRNAGFAVAMSIDYTLRLLNRKGPEQVIKTASLSVFNPNKYGLRLTKLNLPEGPKSMKVYNKIIQKNYEIGSIFSPRSVHVNAANPSQGTASGATTIQIKEVLVPTYTMIKQSRIRLSQRNSINQVGNEAAELVYGQGRLVIPIDPTDNLIKFIVQQTNPVDATKQDRVDLNNNSEFRLVFGKTNDFVFAAEVDPNLTSPSQGELAFRVPKEFAKRLASTTDPNFHISIVSKADGTETMMYTGTWAPSEKYADILAADEDALAVVANEAVVVQLQQLVAQLTSQNESLAEEIASLKSQQNPAPPSGTLPTILGNINNINAVNASPNLPSLD